MRDRVEHASHQPVHRGDAVTQPDGHGFRFRSEGGLGFESSAAERKPGASPVDRVGNGGVGEAKVEGNAFRGGIAVDPARAHWWEVFGTVRWGVICLTQAWRHLSGSVKSMELASIGRRAVETEVDLLQLLKEAS